MPDIAIYFKSNFWEHEIEEYTPCSKVAHKFLRNLKQNYHMIQSFHLWNVSKRNEKTD